MFPGKIANASTSTRTTFKLINDRLKEGLAWHSSPQVVVSRVRWNAQENPALAATLDVQDRVRIEFRGTTQDSRIVGIKHDMLGDRWVMKWNWCGANPVS